MKLTLLNTHLGLKPVYDEDYDERKKLKVGECYTAEIKLVRNLKFHRKYHALINCAWEFLPENYTEGFVNVRNFRKTLEVAAGHYDLFYSAERMEWLQIPKSISFEKMDEAQFEDLYNSVLDAIYKFLGPIASDEFKSNLATFE